MALFLWAPKNAYIKQKRHTHTAHWFQVVCKYKWGEYIRLFKYIHQLSKTVVVKQIYSALLTSVKNGTKL